MNSEERNPESILDSTISEVRNTPVSPELVEQARLRAWGKIAQAAANPEVSATRISNCADFQSLLPEYVAGTLARGRRMLVEDHTHECVACRRVLHGLHQPAPKVVPLVRRSPAPAWRRYAIAASLIVTAGLAGWRAYEAYGPAPAGSRATIQVASGAVYRISNAGPQVLAVGAEIQENETIRTAPGAHVVLKLRDGSLMEADERAEFSVSAQRKDTTVRLDRGVVIVEAVKRREGHLYVASADCRVAVTGTIFSVNRGLKGSRVSVVEGEVRVQHSGRDVTLKPGDQLATDVSIGSVPIRDEISWSRNREEYVGLLNALSTLKSKLEAIRMPELRYGSRLLELAPADTVVFVSVPNMGQAIGEAHRLFIDQIQQTPALQQAFGPEGPKTADMKLMVDTIQRFSGYIGDEVLVTLSARARVRDATPVLVAEVQRAGFREFLNTELSKLNAEHPASLARIIDPGSPLPAERSGGLVIALRGNYVVAGEDVATITDIVRNVENAGQRKFASSDFGRRLTHAFRQGTGVLVGFDLQRLAGIEQRTMTGDKESWNVLGADRIRYLVVEQKQIGNDTQHSADLSFAGERTGFASWLGSPAPIGGLSFISSDAQLAVAGVFKNPEQVVDDLLAFKTDASRIFEEARKHLGIDVKNDVAAVLGGEVAFAIDGPLVPTPSWKIVFDVNDPVRLQAAIEKIVNSASLVAQLSGRLGYRIDSEVVSGTTYYTVRVLDETSIPEIHYQYVDGYLLIAPNRGLLTRSVQSRRAGITLPRSERFRKLLPVDRHANFSAVAYQNAGQLLGAVANAVGSAEQRSAGEAAAKVGPMLICAYGSQNRIEVVNKGSSWDLVMQSVMRPLLFRGTSGQNSTYR